MTRDASNFGAALNGRPAFGRALSKRKALAEGCIKWRTVNGLLLMK